MAQGIDFLERFSRVIPIGVACNKAVRSIEPAADGGLIAPNAARRCDMLRGNSRSGSGEISRFVVKIIGFSDTGGGSSCGIGWTTGLGIVGSRRINCHD